MFQRSILIFALVIGNFLFALPLSGQAATTEPLLVVDFGSLIRATNMDAKIDNQLKEAGHRLDAQLKQAANDLNKQLKEAKNKAGKKPSSKERTKLSQLSVNAQQRMVNLRQRARDELLQLRANMVKQLRDQIKPIAEKIAHKRGAKAVLLVGETMLWYDPEADITADVLAEVRAHPLKLKPLPPVVSSKSNAPKDKADTKMK